MYHEAALGFGGSVRRQAAAAVHRVMLAALSVAAPVGYLSTPRWEPILRAWAVRRQRTIWLPVPVTVPTDPPADLVAAARAAAGGSPLVGHFGTYAPPVADLLGPVLDRVLAARPDVRVLLIGGGSDRFRDEYVSRRPDLGSRMTATGRVEGLHVSAAVRACDVMVQPFPDGANGRRTTLMAALANGTAVVSTDGGRGGGVPEEPFRTGRPFPLVDPDDPDGLAAAVLRFVADPDERARVAAACAHLYADHFDLSHTVRGLLAPVSG
jgi:glycosyltransferase involved in cell wall biosynthesis